LLSITLMLPWMVMMAEASWLSPAPTQFNTVAICRAASL
jgi:hypothetical protein